MVTIAVGATVPWLLGMLTKIPGATGSYERFMDWCREQLELKRVVSCPVRIVTILPNSL